MGILLLFFDGVGVGVDDPSVNPFAAIGAEFLGAAAGRRTDGATFKPLDATLGLPGLPQSATGQTTLLTGRNAARHAGAHLVGLPGPSLAPLIEEHSVFLKIVREGKRATFANAYTRDHLEARRPRWSATTRAVRAAGIRFRLLDPDALRGEALYHDYTGERLRDRGIAAPSLGANEAAEILCGLVDRHDFVLYEYFLTDLAGHRGTWNERVEQARRVEALVAACHARIDRSRHLMLVVSDHGNLEDATGKTHTLNPVPLLGWGVGAGAFVASVGSMDGLTPALVSRVAGSGESL